MVSSMAKSNFTDSSKENPDISWSEHKVVMFLIENPEEVGTAIMAIYDRQTAYEKAMEHTVEGNGIGFNMTDARLGSFYAKMVKDKQPFPLIHQEKALRLAIKYRKQIAEIKNQEVARSNRAS